MRSARLLHLLPRLALVAAALGLVYGCGSSSLNAPPPSAPSLVVLPESDPPAFVRTPNAPPPTMVVRATPTVINPIVLIDTAVTEIARQVVPIDQDVTLLGGRCRMLIHAGSLGQDTDISIGYWDADFLAFDFKPEGTTFRRAVELCVDLSGTNVDPSSPNFDGTKPKFFWLNKPGGVWEELPGSFDEATMQFKVQLNHFSTYAVGSKAGW